MERSQDDTKTMLSPTGVIPVAPASFGKYTIVARLGRGGMADIFLAIHAGPSGFRKLVVVKRLRESYEHDKRIVDMFMDEARLAARLEHPNLVHAFDFGEHEEHHFLAMEFLEGQTLARTLRRILRGGQEVPLDFLLHVAMEVLEGLHHAHELADFDGTPLGVVHRDVSPANVMITYAGVVKLLDFGVAKSATQMTETDPNVRKGKFAYLSPEQIEGRVDRRSDIFSFGIVLWEAIAGKRLFLAADPASTMKKVVSAPIPSFDFVSTRKVPKELDRIVKKALSRSQSLRYQTAAEMRHDIEMLVEREGLGMRRKDLAGFVLETFTDLREQQGRDIADSVAAGLETATQMFEVLRPLTTPSLAREEKPGAPKSATPEAPPPEPTSDGGGTEPKGRSFRVEPRASWLALGAVLVVLLVWLVGAAVGSEDVSEPKHAAAPKPDEPPPTMASAPPGGEDDSGGDGRDLEAFEAQRALGRTHFAAGDYEQAVVAYEEATRINPAHAGSFAGLGASLLAAGRTEEGLSAYQEAVRLAPTHSGFHAALGRAYRDAGRNELAIEAYREAYRLDRRNRAAREALRQLGALGRR